MIVTPLLLAVLISLANCGPILSPKDIVPRTEGEGQGKRSALHSTHEQPAQLYDGSYRGIPGPEDIPGFIPLDPSSSHHHSFHNIHGLQEQHSQKVDVGHQQSSAPSTIVHPLRNNQGLNKRRSHSRRVYQSSRRVGSSSPRVTSVKVSPNTKVFILSNGKSIKGGRRGQTDVYTVHGSSYVSRNSPKKSSLYHVSNVHDLSKPHHRYGRDISYSTQNRRQSKNPIIIFLSGKKRNFKQSRGKDLLSGIISGIKRDIYNKQNNKKSKQLKETDTSESIFKHDKLLNIKNSQLKVVQTNKANPIQKTFKTKTNLKSETNDHPRGSILLKSIIGGITKDIYGNNPTHAKFSSHNPDINSDISRKEDLLSSIISGINRDIIDKEEMFPSTNHAKLSNLNPNINSGGVHEEVIVAPSIRKEDLLSRSISGINRDIIEKDKKFPSTNPAKLSSIIPNIDSGVHKEVIAVPSSKKEDLLSSIISGINRDIIEKDKRFPSTNLAKLSSIIPNIDSGVHEEVIVVPSSEKEDLLSSIISGINRDIIEKEKRFPRTNQPTTTQSTTEVSNLKAVTVTVKENSDVVTEGIGIRRLK